MPISSEPPSTPAAPVDRALLWLTLAGLVARIAFLVFEPRCQLTGDEPSWIALGVNELGRPNRGLSPLRVRLIFYPPVYPYFVALLYRVFDNVRAVLWAQAVLGALLVPAVGRVGVRLLGRRTGLLAAAFAAFYPELLWYAAHFWSETLYMLLLWWALERTLAADEKGSWRTAVAAGGLWGLATLTRELSLYLLPIAVLWLLRGPLAEALAGLRAGMARSARGRVPTAKTLVTVAALVAATALTIAPWTLRNALVYRSFIPVSTMGGLNLWQGNTTLTHTRIYELLATKGGPVEQDRFCRAMAWQAILERQPGWVLDKLREQMPEFWKAGSEVLDHVGGREACGPLSARRIVALELAFVLPYLITLALFLVGLARLRWSAGTFLLLALLTAYNAAHVVAYSTTRFRLPILPVLFLIVAAVLAGDRDGGIRPLTPRRAALFAGLVLAAVATLVPGLEELVSWRLLTGQAAP